MTDFAALDKPTASDLARWKRLALDGVDIATEPFRMAIGRVGAEDYYARVIVYQDGTLNLTRLLTAGQPPEPAPPPAVASPDQGRARARGAAGHDRPDRARGRQRELLRFLRAPELFGQPHRRDRQRDDDVRRAGGRYRDRGRVDRTAPVEMSGRIHPFAKELSLDIAAKARDVDLPPLTPYAVKYAGYGIEKGKLTFDVHYRVEKRKLTAENRLVLDQLTFNPQRVESPTATKLPVLLAVALLKDTRGVIDIQLPIAGSLDDPKFSVGGLSSR